MPSPITVLPSTIEGIRRLATSIKREQRIPHTKALDVAAHRAGFCNFRHAQRHFASAGARSGAGSPSHATWITAYWRDKEHQTGRETLRIECDQPWPRLLKASELVAARGLCRFRADAHDHFETPKDLADQAAARRAVCEAARTLQFMDASGLRPLTGQVYRATRGLEKLPRCDHASTWRDPASGAVIVVDEPYSATIEGLLAERRPWADETGAAIAATTWAGMYYPGSATMFLTSQDGRTDLLQGVVSQLDAAPAPVDAEQWQGESAPYTPMFISPARTSSGKAKRPRPRPLYLGLVRRNAIVYGGSSWRPNARMPLAAHQEVGNLLKELLELGGFRSRAHSRVDHVRSELDEWVQREYPSQEELANEQFYVLYYHGFATSGLDVRAAIARVEEIVRAHYPDCMPRRDVLRSLDTARKDLER